MLPKLYPLTMLSLSGRRGGIWWGQPLTMLGVINSSFHTQHLFIITREGSKYSSPVSQSVLCPTSHHWADSERFPILQRRE